MDSVADRSLRGSAVASGGVVFISYPLLNEAKSIYGVVESEFAVEQADEAAGRLRRPQLIGSVR